MNRNSIGSILLKNEKFPTYASIQKDVVDRMKMNIEVVVISIFEFKNEEDYESYIS